MPTLNKKQPTGRVRKKRKRVKLPRNSNLNRRLLTEFEYFLELVPPRRLSRSLRNMFLQFLPSYVKDGVPTNLDKSVADLYFLLELLDNSAEELESNGRRENSITENHLGNNHRDNQVSRK